MSLHVSSVTAFIIRRSNYINTSSGMSSLEITNLTHFFSCIYLFHVSTCFERDSAHHQEIELY